MWIRVFVVDRMSYQSLGLMVVVAVIVVEECLFANWVVVFEKDLIGHLVAVVVEKSLFVAVAKDLFGNPFVVDRLNHRYLGLRIVEGALLVIVVVVVVVGE